jgi:hypothetical protein
MHIPRWVAISLVALTGARIAAAVWAAVSNTRGDFYASLPGAYVRTVNPTLWESGDMAGAWGYHAETYFHGPAQYLTLYPLAYLDSYAAIARVLLPVYVVLLGIAFCLLNAAIRRLTGGAALTAPLFAATFLFFPLLQSFIQREFETVVFLVLAGALWALVQDRRSLAGALLGYIAWFKYVTLMFVAYLTLRRWWRAVAAFLAVSALVLLIAEAVFDLALFVNNNVPNHAAQVFNLWSYGFERGQYEYFFGTGFCFGWIETETTLSNVRHGLCSLSFYHPWLPANVVYVALCLAVAIVYLLAHARLERMHPLSPHDERWRRAIEFSIVTTVYSCFLFNHYYYLIVLVIPFTVLLARYLTRNSVRGLSLWLVAYVSVSAFLVPASVLTRLTGADVWAVYIKGAWFLWGELILMALLLSEYWQLQEHRVGEQRVLQPHHPA